VVAGGGGAWLTGGRGVVTTGGGVARREGEELMTGVAVPLLLVLEQLEDVELVDMFEHDPVEQQEAELEEEELAEAEDETADFDELFEEFVEAGLNKLRSLLGLATPSAW